MKVIIDTTNDTSKVEQPEKIEEIKAELVIPFEDQKTIRIANVGLPIHDTATGLTGFNGQVFLVDTGSTRYFCAYIEGTLYRIVIN